MAKSSYNKQFKKGTTPQEPVYFETTLNQHEADSPSKQRKRNSIQLGASSEAYPGLSAPRSPSIKRKKR